LHGNSIPKIGSYYFWPCLRTPFLLIEATIDPLTAVLDGMKVLLKLYQMPIPARTSLAVDSMPTLVKNALPNQ